MSSLVSSSPVISNCRFVDNFCDAAFGDAFYSSSSPIIRYTTFSKTAPTINTGNVNTGDVHVYYSGLLTLQSNTISSLYIGEMSKAKFVDTSLHITAVGTTNTLCKGSGGLLENLVENKPSDPFCLQNRSIQDNHRDKSIDDHLDNTIYLLLDGQARRNSSLYSVHFVNIVPKADTEPNQTMSIETNLPDSEKQMNFHAEQRLTVCMPEMQGLHCETEWSGAFWALMALVSTICCIAALRLAWRYYIYQRDWKVISSQMLLYVCVYPSVCLPVLLHARGWV